MTVVVPTRTSSTSFTPQVNGSHSAATVTASANTTSRTLAQGRISVPRSIDFVCSACGTRVWAIASVDETRTCACGHEMSQDWLPRIKHDAQWDDNTSVLVLVNDDPSCPADVRTRYPGRHDCRVPAGYRRVYLRSLQEVNRFERDHKVANHVMHYDSNGRDITDYQGSH